MSDYGKIESQASEYAINMAANKPFKTMSERIEYKNKIKQEYIKEKTATKISNEKSKSLSKDLYNPCSYNPQTYD